MTLEDVEKLTKKDCREMPIARLDLMFMRCQIGTWFESSPIPGRTPKAFRLAAMGETWDAALKNWEKK